MSFKSHLATALGAALLGGAILSAVPTEPSNTRVTIEQVASTTKPKPSAYCSKKLLGKKVKYTTPSGSNTYYLKCTRTYTQKWTRVK